MVSSADQLPSLLSKRLNVSPDQVRFVIERLSAGDAIPFISQYHRDSTGGLSIEQIVDIRDSVTASKELCIRKEAVIKSIADQKLLTEELRASIDGAESMQQIDDVFLPFKRKKDTRRSRDFSDAIRSLANEFIEGSVSNADLPGKAAGLVDAENGMATAADVEKAVRECVAELFSQNIKVRRIARRLLSSKGLLKAKEFVEPPESSEEESATAESTPDKESAAESNASADQVESSSSTDSAKPEDDSVAEESPPAKAEDSTPESPKTETVASDQPVAEGKALKEDGAKEAFAKEEPAKEDGEAKTAEAAEKKKTTPEVIDVVKGVKIPVQATTAEQRRQQRRDARRRKRDQLKSSFKGYFNFSTPISDVASHQLLALDRGERFRVLDVKLVGDEKAINEECLAVLVKDGHANADELRKCGVDALQRLVLPSIEREVRRSHYDKAEENSMRVCARNLRNLLMQPPIRRRVLAIDPGLKYGCKVVAIDQHGQPLGDTTVHAIGDADRVNEGRRRMVALIDEHKLEVVAIGDGTGCRQAETTVSTMLEKELAGREISYAIVNEGGSSAYSTGPLAKSELPDMDPRLRAAIAIGRRLQNPLAEMSKVEPALITMSEIRNDTKTKSLMRFLHDEVVSCVTSVGVDANLATPSLMKSLPGLDANVAENILQHRTENGPFQSREDLKQVEGIQSGYDQAIAYLCIFDGKNALDATEVHPDDYEVAAKLVSAAGLTMDDLSAEIKRNLDAPLISIKPQLAKAAAKPADKPAADESVTDKPAADSESSKPPEKSTWTTKWPGLDRDKVAGELDVSRQKVDMIWQALEQPGKDVRYASSPPIFRSSVTRIETLQPNMALSGVVLNVVDFGAFVDIGIKESGLVHISQLADRYIGDPREVVQVGDVMRVWVVSIDQQKRRVSLTAIPPGVKRTASKKGESSPARRPRRKTDSSRPARQKSQRYEHRPRARKKPKPPARPITDDMVKGTEPMRTFGDLAQFYDKARTDTKGAKGGKSKGSKKSPDKSGDDKNQA